MTMPEILDYVPMLISVVALLMGLDGLRLARSARQKAERMHRLLDERGVPRVKRVDGKMSLITQHGPTR